MEKRTITKCQCHKCGGDAFIVSMLTHDEVEFLCTLYSDATFDTENVWKEHVGETELVEHIATCADCGKEYDISGDKVIPK